MDVKILVMYLAVDGITTNYKIIDKNNRQKAIVFLHGWQRSLADWEGIAHSLSQKHKCVLLDLPGFGFSAPPPKPFDIHDYADFTIKFLEKLKIRKGILLGHSFGGKIAAAVCAKSNKAEKLILVASSGIPENSIKLKSLNAAYSIFKPLIKFAPPALVLALKNKMGSRDYKNAGIMQKTFVKIVNQNVSNLLPKISTPTLIIWGDKDKVLNVKQAKTFNRLIKNSHLRIVWGAGHHPHIEKKDAFLEILEGFL